jgi:glycosyltransferase involved in cell wall biosynthesis
MSKHNLWIDLTDFTIWRGVHTGTQRVVYQIAQYIKEENNVRFCSYDYQARVYKETSFAVVFGAATEPTAKATVTAATVKEYARKSYRLIAPPVVHRVVGKIRRPKETNTTPEEAAVNIEVDFNKNDVLLVLGGNWDKPYFIDALEKVSMLGVSVVHNINDLIPIFDKGHVSSDEHVRYERYMKRVFELSSSLTAISEHTKKDIRTYCKRESIECPKISVIRLGDNSVTEVTKKPTNPPKEFILSVSTIEVRKNHQLLYYAYKEAVKRGVELPQLILAGKRGWLTGDLQYMLTHDPEIKHQIRIIEGPSDEELSWLYKNCLFTVYPSFYEGWGLPVAESIQYGKFCLATSATSVPEVAGDLLDYFSPFDSVSCLEGIVNLTDEKYRKKKEDKLKDKYVDTTWSQTAQQIIEVISAQG